MSEKRSTGSVVADKNRHHIFHTPRVQSMPSHNTQRIPASKRRVQPRESPVDSTPHDVYRSFPKFWTPIWHSKITFLSCRTAEPWRPSVCHLQESWQFCRTCSQVPMVLKAVDVFNNPSSPSGVRASTGAAASRAIQLLLGGGHGLPQWSKAINDQTLGPGMFVGDALPPFRRRTHYVAFLWPSFFRGCMTQFGSWFLKALLVLKLPLLVRPKQLEN